MNYIHQNKSISTQIKAQSSDSRDSSVERFESGSCNITESDLSLIKQELSNSIKSIKLGLTNLDFEAAHLLNPPEFEINCFSDNNKATNGEINISCLSESSTESKSKYVSNPPDLTFSFYSSTDNISPLSTIVSSSSNIIDPSHQTLEKMPNSSVDEVNLFSENGLESQTSVKEDQSNLVPKLEEAKDLKPSKAKEESNNTSVKIHDLVESLLNIKSALDNLEREAAHLLNPPELKLSYLTDISGQAPSSLENNEF